MTGILKPMTLSLASDGVTSREDELLTEETFELGTVFQEMANNWATWSVSILTVFVTLSQLGQDVILFTAGVAKDFPGTTRF